MDNESLSTKKISWYWEVLSWKYKKYIKYKLDNFGDLNLDEAQNYFNNQILWILIDIDDCIAPAYWEILEENKEKIRNLIESWIKIWILSNWIKIRERVKDLLELWVILCETKKSKPDIKAFEESCSMIWVSKENTIMIWDDISKDWWGLQNLLWYIPVRPIWNSYKNIPSNKHINYFFKKVSRWIANFINKI